MSKVRIRYRTYEFGDTDIHVRTLRDRQQFTENDSAAALAGVAEASWALFGVVWDSGEVLARLMHDYDVSGLRILEAGCGIGLASLVLQSRNADVTASDLHPAAGAYLSANSTLNDFNDLPFVQADWASSGEALGTFDLIIGSDLLYEAWGVEPLSQFMNRHCSTNGRILVVDPGRGLQGRFRRAMAARGFNQLATQAVTSTLNPDYKGRLLAFSRGP